VTGAPPDAATPLRLARAQRVAPELVAIAERALRPDPNDRYPTARAFADDLLAWFEGRRVSAHQYSTAEVMARYFARWRIPLAVGMLGLAAVSVATTYGWWQTDGARRQALASEAAALKARADEVQAFATALRTQAGNAAAAGFDMEAELLAAHALKRLEHPDTRGVLAAVSGRPRWTLVASHAAPNCQRRSISPDGSALLCFDDKAARLVDLRTGAEERREGAWNRGTFAGAPDQLVLVDESMVAYAWQAGSAPVAVDGETARWSVFPASLTAGQTLIQTNKAALRIDVLKGTATPTAPCGASHTQRATLDYRGLELTVCDDLRVLAQQPDGSVTTLHRFPTAEGVPSFVAAFADGRTFAGTLQGYAVVVSRAGEVLNHARLGADAIFAASLTPHRAAIGLSGGDVVIWDLAANTVTTRIRGRDIATAWLDDETLRFSGARIEDIRAPLDTHPHRITLDSGVAAVTFSPDGSRMAATTGSGSVTVIEVSTGRRVAAFRSETAVAKDAAFSPDGQRLAVASAGKIQRVYDLATGEETDVRVAEAWRRILWFREAGILGSPYATRLRWAGNGLDAEPEALPDPPGLEDAESCSAGGHAVGLASNGELWWADDGSRPAWRRLAQPEKPMAAACNAASAIVISDQEVRRYALDGTVSWRAAVPGTGIDVAITPDDRWVAVGTMDGSVHVWRVGEAKPRVRLLGHRARAAAVAFSPDSRWLATGAWDDDVRQWAVSAFEADATATASEVEAALGSRLDEVMGTMFTVP
jgi:WD40 repeat protein